MKIVYKPFGIILGIIAGLISRQIFSRVWGLIDEEEPPKATTQETSWPKVIGAAVVQASTFAATRAAVDRAGARGFERLTGVWPGEKRPDTPDED